MRYYLLAFTALGLGALASPASAQRFVPGGDGIPVVCAFNTSPPTVSSGQLVYAQCDNKGQLLGTGGGGGGGGTSSNFSTGFPSAGTAAGFIGSNGNMTGGTLDASGNLDVNVAAGTVTFSWPGTAGNAAGGTTTAGTMPYVNAYIRSTSGSIVSGTFASGAFASGSYAAGAFSSGSFVSGALVDGAITTIGTEADTAWTSGSGTEIAILKKIAGNTAAGGGAVTLASGAVAAGAYSAGSFVSGALLSGALADGAITTIGTEADAAWTSGSGTEIAILKKIAGNTASTAVTLAASSVSAGAYASGSFVSGALADGAINTLGTQADTAWASGSGTAISILKKIAGNTTPFSGAVTQAAGSVASGAYSSGSFVSGALADGAITTIGTEADAAWSSGSGTEIAILKKIAGNTVAPTAVNGWLTGAIDTPITAATTQASTTISSSAAEVLAENIGGTNTAYCGIGGTATSSYKALQPNGGWFVWQVNGATQLTCITTSSTTTVNVQTGSGLATGTGGGGTGGGSTWGAGSTAALTNFGITPTGTVPAVNAYITNGNQNVSSNAQEAASPTVPILQANGGLTYGPSGLLTLNNTAVVIKASAGQLFKVQCYNPNATVAYLQIWDNASAASGTEGDVVPIPETSNSGWTLSGIGEQYANGITVRGSTSTTSTGSLGSALVCNAAFN